MPHLTHMRSSKIIQKQFDQNIAKLGREQEAL